MLTICTIYKYFRAVSREVSHGVGAGSGQLSHLQRVEKVLRTSRKLYARSKHTRSRRASLIQQPYISCSKCCAGFHYHPLPLVPIPLPPTPQMFHYAPLVTRTSLSVNPREKYLAALADAKAAEAEYLAAESVQLEEQALRRRLEEIQLQKQLQGHSLRNSAFGTGQGDFLPSLDVYGDRYTRGYDHLASLRLQIQEEERLRRRNAEREHLRQLEEMRLHDAVARRQAELEQEALRLRREEKARMIITLNMEKRSAQRRARQESARKVSLSSLESNVLTDTVLQDPHCFVLEGHPSREDRYPRQAEEVTLHPHLRAILGDQVRVIPGPASPVRLFGLFYFFPSNSSNNQKPSRQAPVEAVIPPFLEQLFGCERSDAAKPEVQATVPVTPENIRNLVFGGSEQHALSSAAKAPAAPKPSYSQTALATQHPDSLTLQQVAELLLGGAQNQGAGGSGSSPNVRPFSCRTAPNGQYSQPEGLKQLLDLVMGGAPQNASQGSASSSKTQATQPPSSQAAPQAHFPRPEALQQLLGLFLGGQQQQEPAPPASSSQTQPSAAPRPELGGLEQIMNTLFGNQGKEQQVNMDRSVSYPLC